MKRLRIGALALLMATVALFSNGMTQADEAKKSDDKGWVQLFNGKDLDGWISLPEDKARWSVQDGSIVGEGPVGHHIIIKVNDEVVVDTHDGKYTKGHLAIQQHNEGGVVHVRKAEIKELPPTKPEEK